MTSNAYLKADSASRARLRRNIAPAAGRLVCGISWHSIHPEFGGDKSMRLAELRPLLETPGRQFADLQYGNTATYHLAGALGKEAWLMPPLNAARICYWQTERKDSCSFRTCTSCASTARATGTTSSHRSAWR